MLPQQRKAIAKFKEPAHALAFQQKFHRYGPVAWEQRAGLGGTASYAGAPAAMGTDQPTHQRVRPFSVGLALGFRSSCLKAAVSVCVAALDCPGPLFYLIFLPSWGAITRLPS